MPRKAILGEIGGSGSAAMQQGYSETNNFQFRRLQDIPPDLEPTGVCMLRFLLAYCSHESYDVTTLIQGAHATGWNGV